MSREEFLQILRSQLSEAMSEQQVQSHLHYYDQYITNEIHKGRSEADVLESLGDPRLIARTLIDTSGAARETIYEEYNEYRESEPSESPVRRKRSGEIRWLDLSTWYGKLLLILGLVLIIALVVTILSALLPFLLIFILVGIIARYFQKR